MDRNKAAALARQLMNEHGLTHVPFQFNRRKNAFGVCWTRRGGGVDRIELSEVLLPYRKEEEVKNTILHEIAHALAWTEHRDRGHGRVWKHMCRRIGADPVRLGNLSRSAMSEERLEAFVKNESKYKATCTCPKKHVHYFNRMGKHWQRGAYRCQGGKRFEVEQLR